MRTLKKIFNQKGMTLVEILVGAALMGGIALVTAKLMGDQANNQAYLKNSAEIASMVQKIEGLMNDPVHCKAMLGGKMIGTLSPNAPIAIGTTGTLQTIFGITTAAGSPMKILAEQDYGAYTIPDDGVKLQRSVYGGAITDLIITFDMNSAGFISRHRSQVVKRIPFVSQDNAGMITDCGPVLKDAEDVGQKKMCDSLGGAATWNGSKCVLEESRCNYGQVVTQMTSLGGVVCEDIKTQVNLNELFDTSSVNCIGKPKLQIVNSSGKFKIICNP